MYGLAVIEGMTLSGHLSNIDEIYKPYFLISESIGQQLVSNGVLRKTSLLLDLEQDLFLFVISNRNMIGGLRSISKNQFAQRSLPSIGIPTIFCWLQVLLDLRYSAISI